MRALCIEDGGLRFRADVEAPVPAAGEVRVRVRCAGVCATDLALLRGYMGYRGVPGHEFVGVALDGPLAGRRVVGEINAACGACERCRAGLGRHCARRSVLGILGRSGAFADELALPQANLRAVPDGVSDAAATFTEPLAAAFEIDEQVDLTRVDAALVVGDGRLGLLCAQVLALRGVTVTVRGRHPERAEFLPGGITYEAPGAGAQRFPLVVEATGRPDALAAALGQVEPRGTLVLKTTSEAPTTLDLAPLVVDEITLVGSRCGPFDPALAALAAGHVVVEPMVHAHFSLEQGVEALERAGRPGVLKVLIDVSEA
ncbi:MAG: threonine dehydrogenase-like Zn-dependent dehydrogenase [Planctomycetota bacterium]